MIFATGEKIHKVWLLTKTPIIVMRIVCKNLLCCVFEKHQCLIVSVTACTFTSGASDVLTSKRKKNHYRWLMLHFSDHSDYDICVSVGWFLAKQKHVIFCFISHILLFSLVILRYYFYILCPFSWFKTCYKLNFINWLNSSILLLLL